MPGGEQNLLLDLRNQFEYLIGYTKDIPNSVLLAMANAKVYTLRDFTSYAGDHNLIDFKSFPWARYGLDKDEYTSASSIFASQYKEVTGQDIPQAALSEAFKNQRDASGRSLTGAQYRNQLMQDANIQKTYGWVKYGLDYSAWQAQKLSLRTGLGRDVQDSEAAAILQYDTQARGSNQAVVSRTPQSQQQTVGVQGVGQSVVR